MPGVEEQVDNHEKRITTLEGEVKSMEKSLDKICDSFETLTKPDGPFQKLQLDVARIAGMSSSLNIIKWLVIAFMIIVASLAGVEIVNPGSILGNLLGGG